MTEYSDGEMHPQSPKHPSPGPHDSRGGDNEDYHISPEKGLVEPGADPQDFGDGLEKGSDELDRHPATHRGAGMGG